MKTLYELHIEEQKEAWELKAEDLHAELQAWLLQRHKRRQRADALLVSLTILSLGVVVLMTAIAIKNI